MAERTIDTLPPADLDVPRFEYEGYYTPGAICRLRVYRLPSGMPVLVLTELAENTNTSITNRAERVHCLAWEQQERPWPCLFLEHYPGDEGGFEESLSEVSFVLNGAPPAGQPRRIQFHFRNRISGHAFVGAAWQNRNLRAFADAVGAAARRVE